MITWACPYQDGRQISSAGLDYLAKNTYLSAKWRTMHDESSFVRESQAPYGGSRLVSSWDSFSLIDRAQRGISADMMSAIIEQHSFTIAEWADLAGIAHRTFQRYLKQGTLIESLHAERVLSVLEVLDHGVDTFGSEAKFMTWLRRSRPVFRGMSGLELLGYTYGKRIILEELHSIDQGLFA